MATRVGMQARPLHLTAVRQRNGHPMMEILTGKEWRAQRRSQLKRTGWELAKTLYWLLHVALLQWWLLFLGCLVLCLLRPRILHSVDTPVVFPGVILCSFAIGCHINLKLCWARANVPARVWISVLRCSTRLIATAAVSWYQKLPQAYIAGLLVASWTDGAPWYKTLVRFALRQHVDFEQPFSHPDVPLAVLFTPVLLALSQIAKPDMGVIPAVVMLGKAVVLPGIIGYCLNQLMRGTLKLPSRAAAFVGHFVICVSSIKFILQSSRVAVGSLLLLVRASVPINLACITSGYVIPRAFGECKSNCFAISMNTLMLHEPLAIGTTLLLFPNSLPPLAPITFCTIGSCMATFWALAWRITRKQQPVSVMQ